MCLSESLLPREEIERELLSRLQQVILERVFESCSGREDLDAPALALDLVLSMEEAFREGADTLGNDC